MNTKNLILGGFLLFGTGVFSLSQSAETPAKPGIVLKKVAEGFVSPLVLLNYDRTGTLLVVDQVGKAFVLSKEGKVTSFLDLRSKMTKLNAGFDERGFLGLALHPKFQENKRFFVAYSAPLQASAPKGWDHTMHISEFKISAANPNEADLASEKVLLKIDEPFFNHNGGGLKFGPDGYLYIAVGDGGNANDSGKRGPKGNGQDLGTLLGKILRIDVDHGEPYLAPEDNPFKGRAGARPEIWAYGLRNPWGISFDRGGARQLFAADVGQDSFEEIDIIEKGGNYGWNIREGFSCFDPKKPIAPPEDCPDVAADGTPLIKPILAYKNFKRFSKDPEAQGTSVTGGYVYRGKALPQLTGRYVFADWSRNWTKADGVLYTATRSESNNTPWKMEPLSLADYPDGRIGAYIVALAEDEEGELYVLTNGSNAITERSGRIYKLVPGH